MGSSEGLDSDEGDNALRTTGMGHRTDPRDFKPLLDNYTWCFKSSGAQPKNLANNFDPVYLDVEMPFCGVGEPNEYQAICNPSHADSSRSQAPHFLPEKTRTSFHRRHNNSLSPIPERSPQAFAQRPFNPIGHVMPSDLDASHTSSSGYWNNDQKTPDYCTQDQLLFSDLTDNLRPSAPEQGHNAGPPDRLPLSYSLPVVRDTTTNPVDIPDWSEYIPQDSNLGMYIPTYSPFGSLERPISESIYRIYTRTQASANQPVPHIEGSFIPSTVAEFSEQPSHSNDGYYPNFGSGPIEISSSFQNVMLIPGAPVDSPMTVLPVDAQNGDQIPTTDWETQFNGSKFIQGATLGSPPKFRPICASRPSVSPPSPCHSLGPIATFQQVESKSTGFTCDFAPKEIHNPEGLEQKLEIPESFQDVFDLKTGKKPTTKSRRRPSSVQRRNTSYVRKVGACEICRAGKRRCECKLNKGARVIDKAPQPRKRGRKKKIGVPPSAPVGCKQSRRSSMPSVNYNSPMGPLTSIKRRQSNISLETYATSNTSFSAESTGGPAMISYTSPGEVDMRTATELQGGEKRTERITKYPQGIGSEWREASLATVDERTRWPPGTFLAPELPLRPVPYVRRQTSSQPSLQYQDMTPNPSGSTREMYDVSLRGPNPIIPRPILRTSKSLTNHIDESPVIVATTQLHMRVKSDDSFNLSPIQYHGTNLGSEDGSPLAGDYDASVEQGWSEGMDI